jgi:magnesium chelatase subunit D
MARRRLHSITPEEGQIERLCAAAAAFAIPSARAELLALRAARAASALLGRKTVAEDDAAMAARLVLPQRAQRLPQTGEPQEQQQPQDVSDDVEQESGVKSQSESPPEEILVDAIRAAIPAGLLEMLQKQHGRRRQQKAGGRGGPRAKSRRRGRPVGVKHCEQPGSERLNVLATLKAAAPWQQLRRKSSGRGADALLIRKEDLHVTRYQDRVETTTVFLVDASGSQAAQRLAEVKGAIELLLHDCYVRRDQVALIAFRGTAAEVLLPPTRALARVKRSLAALPGGGGTPLAAGLDSAREMAESVAHHGRIPAIVVMTDGRANISRDNQQGSAQAEQDAMAAAKLFRSAGIQSLLVDTSRRPRPRAQALADAMGAQYVPLPFADAATISATVQRSVA